MFFYEYSELEFFAIMKVFYRSLSCILACLFLFGCGEPVVDESVGATGTYSVSCDYVTYYEKILCHPERAKLYLKIKKIFDDCISGQLKEFYDMDVVIIEDKFLETVRMVVYDNPRYGVLYDGLSWSVLDKTKVCPKFSNPCGMVVPDETYDELYASIIKSESNESNIARKLFLWLSNNIVYDDNHEGLSNTDYNVLYNNRGCCQGISFAYKRLLACAGIESFVLTGYNRDGEYHMLNAVCLDGKIMFVDVTGSLSCDSDFSKLRYFCMSESDFRTCMSSFVLSCL